MKKTTRQITKTILNKALVGLTAVLIALFCSVPEQAFAYDSDTTLYFAGSEVTGTSSGCGWSYDASTNTLTLDSFFYIGSGLFSVEDDCDIIDWDDPEDDEDDWDDSDDEDDDEDDWDDEEDDWDDSDDEDEDEDDWDDEEDDDWDDEDDEDDVEYEYEYTDERTFIDIIGVINADGPLTIRLKGENYITINDAGSDSSYGVNVEGNLTIEGDGALYVKSSAGTEIYEKASGGQGNDSGPAIVWVPVDPDTESETEEWVWVDEPEEKEVVEWVWPDAPTPSKVETPTPQITPVPSENKEVTENTEKTNTTGSTNTTDTKRSPEPVSKPQTVPETGNNTQAAPETSTDPQVTPETKTDTGEINDEATDDFTVADTGNSAKGESNSPSDSSDLSDEGGGYSVADSGTPETGDALSMGMLIALITVITAGSAALIIMISLRIKGRI